MPENTPLQRRGGLNIGVEPAQLVPFLQHAGGKQINLDPTVGAEHTLLECPEGVARSISFLGGDLKGGIVVNTTPNTYSYRTFFRDAEGNEVPLMVADQNVPNTFVTPFSYQTGDLDEFGFTLNPGEKIILKTVATQ